MTLPFRFGGDRAIDILMFLLRLSGLNEVPLGARATCASGGWINWFTHPGIREQTGINSATKWQQANQQVETLMATSSALPRVSVCFSLSKNMIKSLFLLMGIARLIWEMNLYLACCKGWIDDSSLLRHQNHCRFAQWSTSWKPYLGIGVHKPFVKAQVWGCVCWDLRSVSRCTEQGWRSRMINQYYIENLKYYR